MHMIRDPIVAGLGDPPALGGPPARVKVRAGVDRTLPSAPTPTLGPQGGSLIAGIRMRK